MSEAAALRPRLDLAAFGLRVGAACGLMMLGLGLATPGRLGLITAPLLQVLFFLFPLAWYGLFGLLAGLLAAGLARLLDARSRWVRPALAALLLAAGLAYLGSILPRALHKAAPGRFWILVLCAAAAAALVLVPRARRPPASRRVLAAGALVILAGLGLSASWIGGTRSIEHGPVPAAPENAAQLPNLVLVTWDTVRADMLPLYGGRGLETPQLDRLAQDSVVFEQMVAVAPITGPSHASLLTGVMPPTHGLRSNGDTRMSTGVPTLAQDLRAHGYDTAAFVASFPVRGQFGFDRGFRVYDDRLGAEGVADRMVDFQPIDPYAVASLQKLFQRATDAERTEAAIDGPTVLERASAYLQQARPPYFLWVHFYDAHGPHDPAPEYQARAEALAAEAAPLPADPAQSAQNMLGQRAEIMELDHYLGQLRAALEARDPGLERTALLLVADHGECFGEGGYANTHAPSLYEATQHIPAVLRLPGGAGGGRRLGELVSQVDVAPTFCALAGLEPLPGAQGVSLLPLARGDGGLGPRPLFASGLYMEAMLQRMKPEERKIGLRDGEWKLLERAEDPSWVRLFHLPAGEGEDQSAAHPDVLARMQTALARLVQDMPKAGDTSVAVDAEAAAKLSELGYGGGDAHEEEPKRKP